MFLLKDWVDRWGMIVQLRNRDGGDSFNRVGLLFFALGCYKRLHLSDDKFRRPLFSNYRWFVNSLLVCVNLCDGRIRRHPDPNKWYSDFDRGSRDQIRPVISALGIWEDPYLDFWLAKIKKPLKKNFYLFSTNTYRNWVYKDKEIHKIISPDVEHQTKPKSPDYIGPMSGVLGAIIRSEKRILLYPILCLLDFKLLINSVHKFYFTKDNDIANHLVSIIHSYFVYDTPFSFLARLVLNRDMIIRRLSKYFDGEDSPAFVTLYKPLIERIFRG